MKSWQKKVPPYEGTEPYLYLAFADADAGKVWGVLRPLLERGCRVWYAAGSAGSPEELLRRQERAGNAALTAVYLSRAVTEDKDTKSAVLANQSMNRPILCLDDDGEDRTLAMGLRETTPHIPVYRYRDKAEAEEELVRGGAWPGSWRRGCACWRCCCWRWASRAGGISTGFSRRSPTRWSLRTA